MPSSWGSSRPRIEIKSHLYLLHWQAGSFRRKTTVKSQETKDLVSILLTFWSLDHGFILGFLIYKFVAVFPKTWLSQIVVLR